MLFTKKTSILLAILAFLWLTVINTGEFDGDTEMRLQITHSLWTGEEEVEPHYQPRVRGDILAGVQGRGEKRIIATWDLGQSLIMLPGDWLGTQLHPYFPRIEELALRKLVISYFVFIPLNVILALSCYWILRLFEFNDVAGLSTLLWFFGTTNLHYAQVPFQNNQVLLLTILSYIFCLKSLHQKRVVNSIFSGLAAGGSMLIRITSIIHVFSLLTFLGIYSFLQSRRHHIALSFLKTWLIGFIPAFFLGRLLDYWRFGSFLITPQGAWKNSFNNDPLWSKFPEFPDNFPMNGSPTRSILGILLSPAKSLFIYDPLLIPCLILGWIYWKKMSFYIQAYVISVLINLGLHLLLTSRLIYWHGDSAWGARYQVTTIQLLLIPLVALFIQQLLAFNGWKRWVMQGIIITTLVVQLSSVMMVYGLEFAQDQIGLTRLEKGPVGVESKLGFRLGQRIINIACLIDDSISQKCISQIEDPKIKKTFMHYNQIYWIPFKFYKFYLNRKHTFILWGVVLVFAISLTISYLFFPKLLF